MSERQRPNLKEALKFATAGDVFLSYNREHIVSYLIGEATNSKWSHTMIYLGNGMIAQTGPEGAHIAPVKKYFSGAHNVVIMRHIALSPEQRKELTQDVLEKMKKRYGYMQIAWYLFIRILGKSEDPRWQLDIEPDAMVCSEAIAAVYRELGYDIKPGFEPAGVEPVDFYDSEMFECIWKFVID